MSYIQWAANVNKIISDQTSLSIGEGAIQQETLASGGIKKSRLTCSNPPDKYSVVMAFNFVEKDSNGFTECDRFWAWYKGKHKYGMNPFEFPAILLNTNRQQGYSVEEQSYINRNGIQQNIPQTEYYCITSALEGSKSGNAIEIRMTWETYATGVITIPDDEYEIDRIEPYADRVDVILTSQPSTPPSITELGGLFINNTVTTVTATEYDGTLCVTYYYAEKTESGRYTVIIGAKSETFEVD